MAGKTLIYLFSGSALFGGSFVRSVAVPGAGFDVKLATQVGRPYDSRSVERDVRYLWSLGRYDDVRVETSEAPGGGVGITFRTAPRQFFTIRQVRFEPHSFGLQITVPVGTRLDRAQANSIAVGARRQLQDRGFPHAHVDWELVPALGRQSDLKLKIDPGEALRIRGVTFTGDTALPRQELEGALHALRPRRILPGVPHLWNGWRLLPSHTQAAIDADVAHLRSFYFFKGYYDSQVQATDVAAAGTDAHVTIEVRAGRRYETVPPQFCSSLFADRRAAEREGVLDFSASANVDSAGSLSSTTEWGERYRVGRIQFVGSKSYSEAFVRRNFVLDEGEAFDERLLRRSVARLNRTGLFDPIDHRGIAIVRTEQAGVADVRIRLAERKRGSWNISGPAGPASFAGPLKGDLSMRLPSWGSGLLELSTYTASVSVFAFARPLFPVFGPSLKGILLPVLSLRRPYTPGEGWRSGFSLTPQFGWRYMPAGYVATQFEQRLLPLLNGDRGLVPELPVTVHRAAGETVIACEPPGPKLGPLRTAAGIAVQLMGTLTGM